MAAAKAIIAEHGAEALHTRRVAAAVGITHASLHYHFPTKQDLIRAVLDDVIGRQIVRPAIAGQNVLPPPKRLRALLEGMAAQVREDPVHTTVLKELHHYAERDPRSRALLEPRFTGWRGFLVAIITDGQASGEFRSDLDVEATASIIMMLVLGVRLGGSLSPSLDAAVVTQIESLLRR